MLSKKIEYNEIDGNVFDLLVDRLKIVTGIKFEYYVKSFLEKRINSRINSLNLDTAKEYLNYLESNPKEIHNFLDKFTINYSHFFRNYEIFEKLKEYMLKHLFGKRKNIRVWSCPCASGEEPYSIAMLFEQLKRNNSKFLNYEIVASDIDKNAIQAAKTGIYKEYSMHEISETF